MVEILSAFLAFAFIGSLLVVSFLAMNKERKEQIKFRKDYILALNNISNAIRGEWK